MNQYPTASLEFHPRGQERPIISWVWRVNGYYLLNKRRLLTTDLVSDLSQNGLWFFNGLINFVFRFYFRWSCRASRTVRALALHIAFLSSIPGWFSITFSKHGLFLGWGWVEAYGIWEEKETSGHKTLTAGKGFLFWSLNFSCYIFQLGKIKTIKCKMRNTHIQWQIYSNKSLNLLSVVCCVFLLPSHTRRTFTWFK